MPTLTVKGLPDELYMRLKQSAEDNRRSLNAEIIACIERALRSRRVSPEEILARARDLRSLDPQPPLTDEFLDEARRRGRR